MFGRRRTKRGQVADDHDQGRRQGAGGTAPQQNLQGDLHSDASLDQLNGLGEMHDSGILTDEEFDAATAMARPEHDA
jgi:Short C-terminal domain